MQDDKKHRKMRYNFIIIEYTSPINFYILHIEN